MNPDTVLLALSQAWDHLLSRAGLSWPELSVTIEQLLARMRDEPNPDVRAALADEIWANLQSYLHPIEAIALTKRSRGTTHAIL
jgi:hypothetical protein